VHGDHAGALALLEPAPDGGRAGSEAALMRSDVLADLGCHERALALTEAALTAAPGHGGLTTRAVSRLLARERWQEAWALWPRALAAIEARVPGWAPSTAPRWDGSPLDGRRLAVYPHPSVAGDGDIILFARYLPLIAGGRVLVVAPERLHRLVEHSLPGTHAVLPADAARADVWCTNAELPILLSGLAGPPPAAPSLRAAPEDARRWRAAPADGGPVSWLNVGLVWQPGAVEDGPLGARRGIPSGLLGPLARVPGVRWYALQAGPHAQDPLPPPLDVSRLGPHLVDYAATAGVLSLLDLTISVDTSVSNLAGAMAATCWVMLSTAPDCRWGWGERSAWYPSCRLFRQQRPGDWGSVIERVAEALREPVRHRR
jgi:hypothetical protein